MIIAQLSDTHIKDGQQEPTDRLRRAVDHLLQLPAVPDLVLVTGDCTDGGTPTEYALFRELLRPLTMPVHVIPGNHDQRERLRATWGEQGTEVMADYLQYMVTIGPLRLLALDTLLPGHDEGYLAPACLQWLEARLAEAPAQPTIIFMHHPPFRTGHAPFDAIGLTNPADLEAVVARHPQVERVVAGHIHAGAQRRFAGTIAVTCPSTLGQLLPDSLLTDRMRVQQQPPACLLHVWQEGVGLLTYTSPIGEFGPAADLHDGHEWKTLPKPRF